MQHNFDILIELSKLLWWAIFTSNLYFWLPMLVLCFCQKLSGLIRWAVWIALGKYSWSTLRIGFTVDQADPDPPRISIMTVNPRSRTSSLKKENHDRIIIHIICLWKRRIFSKSNHIIVSNSYSLMKLYYQCKSKCSLYRTIRECADTHARKHF